MRSDESVPVLHEMVKLVKTSPCRRFTAGLVYEHVSVDHEEESVMAKGKANVATIIVIGGMSVLGAVSGCGLFGAGPSAQRKAAVVKQSGKHHRPLKGGKGVTIDWAASPITQTGTRQTMVRAFERSHPNIRVKLTTMSTNTDTTRTTLSTEIEGGSATPDVYMGDVIWPAQFAHSGLAVDLSKYFAHGFWSRFAPGLVTGASYRGKVYGAPFFMDAGFLYYRKDLLSKAGLSVPHTWQQLASDAKTLQAKHLVRYGYVWEGASYEGLTCDLMEFLADSGAKVLNAAGTKVTLNSPQAISAVAFMRSLITRGVSPAAVSTYQEPDAMNAFDAGDAAFMRNWDYAWSNSQTPGTKVVGKVGVEPMPAFAGDKQPGYSCIGGWDLYVNPHTHHLKQALTFIRWMTSVPAQRILAKKYSEVPTNYAVQREASVRRKNPVLRIVARVRLIARPSSTPLYPQLSQALYQNVNAALTGQISPTTAISRASREIGADLAGRGL